jgi:hypothetical protein
MTDDTIDRLIQAMKIMLDAQKTMGEMVDSILDRIEKLELAKRD